MFLPIEKVEPWDGVFVTASQSFPPMMGSFDGRASRTFLLPPAWSQWWWVLIMEVRLRDLDFSSRTGRTLVSVLVVTSPQHEGPGVLHILRRICWIDNNGIFCFVITD